MTSTKYRVNEVFGPTIQGEGAMSGTPTIFIRFSGCNMWNGKNEDKADSYCPYCDTDFLSYTPMTINNIVRQVDLLGKGKVQWVTISGGEPLLQLDIELCMALKRAGFKIAVETNGTVEGKPGVVGSIDHICMSPKRPSRFIKLKWAHSLKVLWPPFDEEIDPDEFSKYPLYEQHGLTGRYIQPMDERFPEAVEKVLSLNGWKLSVQTHKIIGVE